MATLIDFREKLKAIDERMRKQLAAPDHLERCARVEASIKADEATQRRFRRRDAGIPGAYWGLIEKPLETDAMVFVREWLESDKPVAILAGQVGVGKSFAMAWAIDQRGGYYVEASDVCRAGWYGDDYWERWSRTPLLALDELGMEPMDEKGWWEAKLHRLLSARLNENRRTLLGTNLDRAALKARYGSAAMARTWDRLENAWMARAFRGQSMRSAEVLKHWSEREPGED